MAKSTSTGAIGLTETTCKNACDALNRDLASLYTLYHQVKKHHWIVEGPNFRDIHLMLDEMAAVLLENADIVAERITALGGYPVSSPTEQQSLACFEMEPEGEFPLRKMMENDLQAYQALVNQVREHIRLVHDEGDFGTVHMLQEMIFDLENDTHHIHHVLQKDTLTK